MEEPETHARSVCEEISGELLEMATWLSAGRLDPEQFRLALLTLETAKVTRHGFTLAGESAENGRTHFELRKADDGHLCASLDFDSGHRALSFHDLAG